jgi:hypothetical protein
VAIIPKRGVGVKGDKVRNTADSKLHLEIWRLLLPHFSEGCLGGSANIHTPRPANEMTSGLK